ncbi:MAG TPA: DUF6583 family protein [Pseudogracilibacillus sp.]|nr:DUF6583 family protein [Pseudogracilibacillus sp.]
MVDSDDGVIKKRGLSKGLLALIIVLVIVVIGVVVYFSMGGGSLKQQYFLAEGETLDEMGNYIEDRYEAEFDWLEVTQEKPTKSSLDISGEYNDPNNEMMGDMFDIGEIVNNSTVQILTESDTPNQQLNATLNADVAGISLQDFSFYLNQNTLTVDLPFLNEKLMINDENLVPLVNEIEPGAIDEETEINFTDLFEAQSQGISEEDLEYLKKEYGMLIYKEVPDSAFESKSEKTEVNGEELKAEKISMHLTEEEVHSILTKVFEKLETDERVKEMLKTQYNALAIQEQEGITTEDMLTDFENDMGRAKESVSKLKMPEGLTSNIWVKDKVVVSREFTTELGEGTDSGTIEVTGNQLIDKEESSLDYKMIFGSENDSVELNLVGLLTKEDTGYNDDISLNIMPDSSGTDILISYLADEKVDGDKTDFDRTFMLSESGMELGKLHWDGQANYEKDQMKSNHSFALEAQGLARDLFILNVDVTGEQIKEVAKVDPEDGKDLGAMSGQEVMEYFETDVTNQFTQWLMTQMQQFE